MVEVVKKFPHFFFTIFYISCKACTRGHYAYPPWCTGEPGPSPARIVTCCEYSPRASSGKRVWRTAARVGAWSFAVWRRAAGNWSPVKRGAVNFEGGRPKIEGGRSATLCRFGWNHANAYSYESSNSYSTASAFTSTSCYIGIVWPRM